MAARLALTRLAGTRIAGIIVSLVGVLGVIPAALAQAPAQSSKREFNIVPIAGGDSDVGFGIGEVSDWARLDPARPPFRWRLESGGFITFKPRGGGVIIPYQDYYLLFSQPRLGGQGRWRLDIRASFTDESTLKYFGLGNASIASSLDGPAYDGEHKRIHPTLAVETRLTVIPNWFLRLGTFYTHTWLSVAPESLLAQQQASADPYVRGVLGDFGSHGLGLLEIGIEHDSRDNEIVTRRGMFHSLKARIAPRIDGWLPYGYVQLNATARFYATPIPRWLTITARVVADAIIGTPPFYELARYDETPAIGGAKALRGVPAQRYYGKVKVFENVELRSEIFPFRLRGKQFVIGTAAFVDAGRVWTELLHAHPELDGTGWGLKYGIGGGLRLQQGETFVVRADFAWSPDASPVGAYFAAGEIF